MLKQRMSLWLVGLAAIGLAQAGQAGDNRIHLVGNFNIRGTPFSEAILLQDPRIQSLAQCWEFVHLQVRGSSRDRNYFRHYIRSQKQGINIQPHYACIESDLAISLWDPRAFYANTYLIDLRNGASFTAVDDINSCWAILNKADMLQKNSKLFCAKMSQTVQPAASAQ